MGLGVFLFLVVIGSALLSPPVFWWIEGWAPDRWPFKRIFNRVLMVTAVLGVLPFLYYIGAWSIRAVGWAPFSGWWKGLLFGWVAGTVHVWFLAGLHLIAGARVWNWELDASRMLGYLAAGLAVGLIEESLFRGGLCLSLRGLALRKLCAVVMAGSLFFALAHFPAARNLPGEVGWDAGWHIWGDLLVQLTDPRELLQRFVGLFLVGLALCILALRTGSLWPAIGLHAGWVTGIKCINRASDATPRAESLWWGGHPLDGVFAWIFLIGLILLIFRFAGGRVSASRSTGMKMDREAEPN